VLAAALGPRDFVDGGGVTAMCTYTQQAGGTRRVRLEVPVRAFWSRPRAWHGEDIVLYVETAYLPDGTSFSLRIHEAHVTPFDEESFIHEKKGLQLVNNRAAVPYRLRWDRASRGRPLVLAGDRFEFFFEVRVEAPRARGRSNLLYVHLHPHVISG
jgi:hypothetical protein